MPGKVLVKGASEGLKSITYAASEQSVVLLMGKFADKVVPKAGALGKGDFPTFCGEKFLAFTAENVSKIRHADGFIDLPGAGLQVVLYLTLPDEDFARKKEEQANGLLDNFDKESKAAPAPAVAEMGELRKTLRISRKSATLRLVVEMSEKQLNLFLKMATGVLGG